MKHIKGKQVKLNTAFAVKTSFAVMLMLAVNTTLASNLPTAASTQETINLNSSMGANQANNPSADSSLISNVYGTAGVPHSKQRTSSVAASAYSGDPASDVASGILIPCPVPVTGCPNINGVYPPGGSAMTCPAHCYITTHYLYTSNYSSYLPELQPFIPQVTQVQPTACPTGYFTDKQFTPPGAGPGVTNKDTNQYGWSTPEAVSPISDTIYSKITNYNTGNPANPIVCAPKGRAGATASASGSCPGSCGAFVGTGTPNKGTDACVAAEGSNMIYLTQCVPDTASGQYSYSYVEMACNPQPGYYSATASNPSLVSMPATVCTLSSYGWHGDFNGGTQANPSP